MDIERELQSLRFVKFGWEDFLIPLFQNTETDVHQLVKEYYSTFHVSDVQKEVGWGHGGAVSLPGC